jgi:hypothetical protein
MENVSENEFDFEKMNATLANPEFANWYFNQVSATNPTVEEFVKIIKDYSEKM